MTLNLSEAHDILELPLGMCYATVRQDIFRKYEVCFGSSHAILRKHTDTVSVTM